MSDYNGGSGAFYAMAWISFGVSSVGTIYGLWLMDASIPVKGFFIMSFLFSISSCFTLAKAVRDRYEAQMLHKKIERAKTEQLLNKYSDGSKE